VNSGSEWDLEVVDELSDTVPCIEAQYFQPPAGQEPIWTPTQIESPDREDFENMANDARGPDPLQNHDAWARSTTAPVPLHPPASLSPMRVDAGGDISSLLQSSPNKKQRQLNVHGLDATGPKPTSPTPAQPKSSAGSSTPAVAAAPPPISLQDISNKQIHNLLMAMNTTISNSAARQDQVFASLKHDFESSLALCRDDLRDGLNTIGDKHDALDNRANGMNDALNARLTGMRSEIFVEVTKHLESELAKKHQVFAAPPILPTNRGAASSSSSREPVWIAKVVPKRLVQFWGIKLGNRLCHR